MLLGGVLTHSISSQLCSTALQPAHTTSRNEDEIPGMGTLDRDTEDVTVLEKPNDLFCDDSTSPEILSALDPNTKGSLMDKLITNLILLLLQISQELTQLLKIL